MIEEVDFKLVGRAVAERGVSAVEIEIGVEIVGHFQPGFLQAGKRAPMGQQLGFEGAPSRFGLRVVVGIARPGIAGQGTSVGDALATGQAGVLAAPVRMDWGGSVKTDSALG